MLSPGRKIWCSLIDESTLALAVAELSAGHPEIEKVVSRYGAPPLWGREPGFASLVYAVLEQQVSLASARAVYLRLESLTNGLSPASLTDLDGDSLRAIGFSRQKTDYCKNLASLVLDGALDLELLESMSDEVARSTLMSIQGIGKWTADIYLLHSLGRPDVWPAGDLALKAGYQEALELEERPSENELDEIGRKYAPWRSVAARIFWHFYLSKRNLKPA